MIVGDLSGDGQLAPAESPGKNIFKQMDQNADGVVTSDEARAFFGGRLQQKTNEN